MPERRKPLWRNLVKGNIIEKNTFKGENYWRGNRWRGNQVKEKPSRGENMKKGKLTKGNLTKQRIGKGELLNGKASQGKKWKVIECLHKNRVSPVPRNEGKLVNKYPAYRQHSALLYMCDSGVPVLYHESKSIPNGT